MSEEKTREQLVEEMISECVKELSSVHEGKGQYDEHRAVGTAALCLKAQFELAEYIYSADLNARQAKREVERVSAEKYHEFKEGSSSGKKLTEVALENLVLKDADVVAAKTACNELEANSKKLNYLMTTLRDAHVYWRNLAKSKAWEE